MDGHGASPPQISESAIERFLSSAFAAILTIIFSWRILLEADSDRRGLRPPDPHQPSSMSDAGNAHGKSTTRKDSQPTNLLQLPPLSPARDNDEDDDGSTLTPSTPQDAAAGTDREGAVSRFEMRMDDLDDSDAGSDGFLIDDDFLLSGASTGKLAKLPIAAAAAGRKPGARDTGIDLPAAGEAGSSHAAPIQNTAADPSHTRSTGLNKALNSGDLVFVRTGIDEEDSDPKQDSSAKRSSRISEDIWRRLKSGRNLEEDFDGEGGVHFEYDLESGGVSFRNEEVIASLENFLLHEGALDSSDSDFDGEFFNRTLETITEEDSDDLRSSSCSEASWRAPHKRSHETAGENEIEMTEFVAGNRSLTVDNDSYACKGVIRRHKKPKMGSRSSGEDATSDGGSLDVTFSDAEPSGSNPAEPYGPFGLQRPAVIGQYIDRTSDFARNRYSWAKEGLSPEEATTPVYSHEVQCAMQVDLLKEHLQLEGCHGITKAGERTLPCDYPDNESPAPVANQSIIKNENAKPTSSTPPHPNIGIGLKHDEDSDYENHMHATSDANSINTQEKQSVCGPNIQLIGHRHSFDNGGPSGLDKQKQGIISNRDLPSVQAETGDSMSGGALSSKSQLTSKGAAGIDQSDSDGSIQGTNSLTIHLQPVMTIPLRTAAPPVAKDLGANDGITPRKVTSDREKKPKAGADRLVKTSTPGSSTLQGATTATAVAPETIPGVAPCPDRTGVKSSMSDLPGKAKKTRKKVSPDAGKKEFVFYSPSSGMTHAPVVGDCNRAASSGESHPTANQMKAKDSTDESLSQYTFQIPAKQHPNQVEPDASSDLLKDAWTKPHQYTSDLEHEHKPAKVLIPQNYIGASPGKTPMHEPMVMDLRRKQHGDDDAGRTIATFSYNHRSATIPHNIPPTSPLDSSQQSLYEHQPMFAFPSARTSLQESQKTAHELPRTTHAHQEVINSRAQPMFGPQSTGLSSSTEEIDASKLGAWIPGSKTALSQPGRSSRQYATAIDSIDIYEAPTTTVCTAKATSTALARREPVSDGDRQEDIVSAVASAEAQGENPYIAIARASARAATVATASAAQTVATSGDPHDSEEENRDIAVIISTSCVIKNKNVDTMLQDTKGVLQSVGQGVSVSVQTKPHHAAISDAATQSSPNLKRRLKITLEQPDNTRHSKELKTLECDLPDAAQQNDIQSIVNTAVKKMLGSDSTSAQQNMKEELRKTIVKQVTEQVVNAYSETNNADRQYKPVNTGVDLPTYSSGVAPWHSQKRDSSPSSMKSSSRSSPERSSLTSSPSRGYMYIGPENKALPSKSLDFTDQSTTDKSGKSKKKPPPRPSTLPSTRPEAHDRSPNQSSKTELKITPSYNQGGSHTNKQETKQKIPKKLSKKSKKRIDTTNEDCEIHIPSVQIDIDKHIPVTMNKHPMPGPSLELIDIDDFKPKKKKKHKTSPQVEEIPIHASVPMSHESSASSTPSSEALLIDLDDYKPTIKKRETTEVPQSSVRPMEAHHLGPFQDEDQKPHSSVWDEWDLGETGPRGSSSKEVHALMKPIDVADHRPKKKKKKEKSLPGSAEKGVDLVGYTSDKKDRRAFVEEDEGSSQHNSSMEMAESMKPEKIPAESRDFTPAKKKGALKTSRAPDQAVLTSGGESVTPAPGTDMQTLSVDSYKPKKASKKVMDIPETMMNPLLVSPVSSPGKPRKCAESIRPMEEQVDVGDHKPQRHAERGMPTPTLKSLEIGEFANGGKQMKQPEDSLSSSEYDSVMETFEPEVADNIDQKPCVNPLPLSKGPAPHQSTQSIDIGKHKVMKATSKENVHSSMEVLDIEPHTPKKLEKTNPEAALEAMHIAPFLKNKAQRTPQAQVDLIDMDDFKPKDGFDKQSALPNSLVPLPIRSQSTEAIISSSDTLVSTDGESNAEMKKKKKKATKSSASEKSPSKMKIRVRSREYDNDGDDEDEFDSTRTRSIPAYQMSSPELHSGNHVASLESQRNPQKKEYHSVLQEPYEDMRTPLHILRKFEVSPKTPLESRTKINNSRQKFYTEDISNKENAIALRRDRPQSMPPQVKPFFVNINLDDTFQVSRNKSNPEELKKQLASAQLKAPPSHIDKVWNARELIAARSQDTGLNHSGRYSLRDYTHRPSSEDGIFQRSRSLTNVDVERFFGNHGPYMGKERGSSSMTPYANEELDGVTSSKAASTSDLLVGGSESVNLASDGLEKHQSMVALPTQAKIRVTENSNFYSNDDNDRSRSESELRISRSLNKLSLPNWYTESLRQHHEIVTLPNTKSPGLSIPEKPTMSSIDPYLPREGRGRPVVIQHWVSPPMRLTSPSSSKVSSPMIEGQPELYNLPSNHLRQKSDPRAYRKVEVKDFREVSARLPSQKIPEKPAREAYLRLREKSRSRDDLDEPQSTSVQENTNQHNAALNADQPTPGEDLKPLKKKKSKKSGEKEKKPKKKKKASSEEINSTSNGSPPQDLTQVSDTLTPLEAQPVEAEAVKKKKKSSKKSKKSGEKGEEGKEKKKRKKSKERKLKSELEVDLQTNEPQNGNFDEAEGPLRTSSPQLSYQPSDLASRRGTAVATARMPSTPASTDNQSDSARGSSLMESSSGSPSSVATVPLHGYNQQVTTGQQQMNGTSVQLRHPMLSEAQNELFDSGFGEMQPRSAHRPTSFPTSSPIYPREHRSSGPFLAYGTASDGMLLEEPVYVNVPRSTSTTYMGMAERRSLRTSQTVDNTAQLQGQSNVSSKSLYDNSVNSQDHPSFDEVLNGLLALPSPALSLGIAPSPRPINFVSDEPPMERALRLLTQACTPQGSLNTTMNTTADNFNNSKADGEVSPLKFAPMPLQTSDVRTSGEIIVKCRNTRCGATAELSEARQTFKTCHNCYTYYCSRECRKSHWEKHKKKCLFSRVNSLCKHVVKKIHDDHNISVELSQMARTGYLSHGRGAIMFVFSSPEEADLFIHSKWNRAIAPPVYISVQDVASSELFGEQVFELSEMCKTYNPEVKYVLEVAVIAGQEVPAKSINRREGPAIKKCVKLHLSTVHGRMTTPKPKLQPDTLILTAVPGSEFTENMEARKAREVCFINIQRQLRQRGVSLRHDFPDVYRKLCAYVSDNVRFPPINLFPVNANTKKRFMCLIMPKSEPDLDWMEAPDLLEELGFDECT